MIRLVVADDAPFIREIVRGVVESNGMSVVGEAANGAEAVELALELSPDVVLMDIIMPVKNGIDAAKEILENCPRTKVVAFSTVDQESLMVRALEAGCCSYLVKPFKAADLIKAIANAVAL